MLDYIWIDGDLPILSQLPNDFNSAAILFHPFIQMPSGWEKSKRANPYQHIYPNDEYKKLASYVKYNPDFYHPEEDRTSLFILNGLIKILCSKGANTLYISEPIHDTNGSFKVNDISSLEMANLSPNESIITDENMDFAFMGIYDSFITLLLAKDTNIEDTIKSQNLEALICSNIVMYRGVRYGSLC
ncbi:MULTISPECIES: DUF2711 family protein [Priestia]|uniref:DUF2711 family protein n=1 Tax=Priestia TaxID=2800373 RepID=UPI002FFDEF3A